MKTLVLTEVFPPRTGGSGRWLWELYSRWPRGGAHIVAGEHTDATAFDAAHDLPIQRIPLTFESWGLVGYRNVRQYTATYRAVVAAIKQQNITQTHCGRILPEGLVAWMISMRHRVPYACYVHGEELNTASTSRELSFLARRVLKGAITLIVNSLNTARILMHQWQVPAAKIDVLNPGVDSKLFVPAAREAASRAELGWGDRRVVLTVGRLQERKGHERLIAALPAVIKQIPDVLYAIVGEGETRRRLEQTIASLGLGNHVRFMGEMRDEQLLRCYQQCDLFVLPNVQVRGDFEGFGMVLVEAQACGKPVITGRSGGTSEAMRDGDTGRLVNCENESDLAGIVAELLGDDALRQRMGEAGRRWVEKRFEWDALARQAQAIFAERFGKRMARRAA